MERVTSRFWFPAIFAVVILSFVLATSIVHWQLSAIDRHALDIAENAAPSIERLATARAEGRHLQSLMEDYLDNNMHDGTRSIRALEQSHRAFDQAIDDYLLLSPFPSENALRLEILRAKEAVDHDVIWFQQRVAQGEVEEARAILTSSFPKAANDLSAAIVHGIDVNAEHANESALRIPWLRARWTYVAFALDIVCTAIAIGGAVFLRRITREHAELAERHRRLSEERASELETFASRVAHDILSPLGSVSFALELAARPGDETQRSRILERGTAALDRVKRLVDGLLDFARSGGRPDKSSRANVGATLRDLVNELEPAAKSAGAEIMVECDERHDVACNVGVLTSLIANLARNAVKYIGEGPVRKIRIRALDRDSVVRLEVEDTGPGLAEGIEERVFHPYVRAPNVKQPGMGLGLATVKRLAEAHGGAVGVRSVRGQGTTFWFELPKAPPADAVDEVASSRHASRGAA